MKINRKKPARYPGLRGRIFFIIAGFVAVMLLVLWAFQLFLLQPMYESAKTREHRLTADRIAAALEMLDVALEEFSLELFGELKREHGVMSCDAVGTEFRDQEGFFDQLMEFIQFRFQQFDGPGQIAGFAGIAPLGITVPAVVTVDTDDVCEFISVILAGTSKAHQSGRPHRIGFADLFRNDAEKLFGFRRLDLTFVAERPRNHRGVIEVTVDEALHHDPGMGLKLFIGHLILFERGKGQFINDHESQFIRQLKDLFAVGVVTCTE